MKKTAVIAAAAVILFSALSACIAEQYIGEAKAKEIALTHAGVLPQAAGFTKIEFEREHGRPEYEIEFFADKVEYDYEIDAVTGLIYKYSAKRRGGSSQAGTASGSEISDAEAKRTALSTVSGATERDITKFNTDYEYGRKVYECDIVCGGRKYEVEVDAVTGDITKWEMDD